MKDTSWKKVGKWYSRITKDGGHYYHTHVVIPGVKRLLDLDANSKLLDLGCGTGVLGQNINPEIDYLGIDMAPNLIDEAIRRDRNPNHEYKVADVTKPLNLKTDFTHATVILALQNMKNPAGTIANAHQHLKKDGKLIIVINHPSFRIPRQSGWGMDEATKRQYRMVYQYMSPLEIPIKVHPGNRNSAITWSYHFPLSAISDLLRSHGFVIETIEEWVSDKESVGKAGKAENRARAEIPLFMCLQAINML